VYQNGSLGKDAESWYDFPAKFLYRLPNIEHVARERKIVRLKFQRLLNTIRDRLKDAQMQHKRQRVDVADLKQLEKSIAESNEFLSGDEEEEERYRQKKRARKYQV